MSDATTSFTAADIRLAGGVGESDRALVAETMQEIIGRLGQLREQAVAELSVKDRDSADPRTTLEVSVHGLPKIVATSAEAELRDALNEVSDVAVRQLRKQMERREAKGSRDTIRG